MRAFCLILAYCHTAPPRGVGTFILQGGRPPVSVLRKEGRSPFGRPPCRGKADIPDTSHINVRSPKADAAALNQRGVSDPVAGNSSGSSLVWWDRGISEKLFRQSAR